MHSATIDNGLGNNYFHKGQGLTLDKVVLDLGEKDFAPGLSFVGISHVKTLNGLVFWTRFEFAHLQKPKETDSMKMPREENERLSQLGLQLDTYGMNMLALFLIKIN